MCILFAKLLKAAKKGEFKMILAANRDELFKRPGRKAHFWEEDPNVFGGRDMTENKEGGTWLAFSKKGRLGVLLNVSGEEPDPQKLNRGYLVADFVKSNMSEMKYSEKLSQNGHRYNKFHLITAMLGQPTPRLVHYSNGNGSAGITDVSDDVFGCGNSSIATPFKKVINGKKKFQEVISEFGNEEKKTELVEKLLHLLKWGVEHYPDQVIDSISKKSLEFNKQYSAVFVDMPEIQYGTRTHTIILVDWQDNADFFEWTLKEPISPENKQWIFTHERFSLEPSLP